MAETERNEMEENRENSGTESGKSEKGRRSGKRSGRRFHKAWLISLAAAALAAVAVACAVIALRGRDTETLEETAYVFVYGARIDLTEKITLSHTEDGTVLKSGDIDRDISDYPLMLADGSVFLQKSCSLNETETDGFYRLDYYTKIGKEGEETVISRRGKEYRNLSGFVYDNKDTYIFLEPVLLRYGEKTMDIPALTVVEVCYQEYFQAYGENMEPCFEVTEEEVVAEFSGGKRLNLSTDCYYRKNGTWRLLFMPTDALPEIGSRDSA